MSEHHSIHQAPIPESTESESEGFASHAPPALQLFASPADENPGIGQPQNLEEGSLSGPEGPIQRQSQNEGGEKLVGDISPGELSEGHPQLEEFEGEAIGLPARICSDATNYGAARSGGMNIRKRPLPTAEDVIGKLLYNTTVTVKCSNLSGGWYFVIADNGTAGWINQSFVALNPPDSQAKLHHVTEPDLTTILKNHYVGGGLWDLSTGNDYTTLAAAVKVANRGRKGVYIDLKQREKYEDDNSARTAVDPMEDNFADYASAVVVAGTNIWLPSPDFIRQLQETGVVASRADWLNTAMDIGDAIVGFSVGFHAGVYGSLWDTLVGLYNIGEQLVSIVKKCFTGEIIDDITGIYDELSTKFEQLSNMSREELAAYASELINMFTTAIADGAMGFAEQWTHPDSWKRWFFRGKVIGQVILEIVLAIFTGGSGNAAKWAGAIGKFSPRLARIITKGLETADDLVPKRLRGGKKDGPDADGPESNGSKRNKEGNDSNEGNENMALLVARRITEFHDEQDSPIPVLKTALKGIQKTFKGVAGYKVDEKIAQPGHYTVMQLTPKEVDNDYTPARKGKGKYTQPTLPPKTIVNQDGIRIEHYTRSGDHGPPHAHVKGGGAETKIGQNGKPIDGSPELTASQRKVVDGNIGTIRKALKKIAAYNRYNEQY